MTVENLQKQSIYLFYCDHIVCGKYTKNTQHCCDVVAYIVLGDKYTKSTQHRCVVMAYIVVGDKYTKQP